MAFPHGFTRPLLCAAAATVLLAGCAAGPTPEPTDATPSESAAPTAAAPTFRLGLGCADILDVATVQAQISQPVSVQVDETSTVSSWYDVNLAQAGGLHCVWGGDDKTDQSWNYGYELWVRPDAQADFDVYYDSQQAQGDNPCDGTLSYPCSTNYTFEGSWVRTYLSDAAEDTAVAAAAFSTLNAIVDEKLGGATVAEPWPAPTSGLDVCAEPEATERASLVLGRPGETLVPPQFAPDYDITTTGGAAVTCGWYDSEDGLELLTAREVAGGGWAFDAMVTDAPQLFLIPPMVATPVPGADVAYVGCGDGCGALVKIGDDYVELGSDAYGEEDFVFVVKAWVAAL